MVISLILNKVVVATNRRHDVAELAVKCSQYLANTGRRLTEDPIAKTVNFFFAIKTKLSSSTSRRRDVGELAVKSSQILAKTGHRLTSGNCFDNTEFVTLRPFKTKC